jgi:putative transposase
MAWGEIKVENRRKDFIEACIKGDLSMTELCHIYQISRKSGYKWLNRYMNEGDQSFEDRSRAPIKQALEIDPDVIKSILDLKFKRKTWGPKKILVELKELYPDCNWPSTTTIGNIFDKNGLTVKRTFRRRVPGRTVPLAHCHQSNDVWCADFKGWFLTENEKKCEPFTLTDAASRFLLRCLRLDRNDIDHVWAVLDTAFREYGLPIFFRHDNGPPFASCGVGRFSGLSVKLIKAGVIPEWIDPGKPQQNGRHERMHQTLKKETASPPQATLEKQDRKFKEFIHYYNYERPHEAIDQKKPGRVYKPSDRNWNGVLRSPEYDIEYDVRKVRYAGSIKFHGNEIYIGTVLAGEPIGLIENEEGCFKVYYGPIILGEIDRNMEFKTPPNNKRIKNVSKK